jgi:ribosomal protein S18 acetylase RimI-like enzyme
LENEIIGFSLLSIQGVETEFRIALKPDKIGKGFGKTVALATITEFYKLHEEDSLYLIVRLSNTVAQSLYKSIGFIPDQELTKDIQGIPVQFLKMKYTKGYIRG